MYLLAMRLKICSRVVWESEYSRMRSAPLLPSRTPKISATESDEADWTESIEKWGELGKITAKMHTIPTSWYQPYRQELIQRNPWAADFEVGSRLWLYISGPCIPPEQRAMDYLEQSPAFRSQYAELGPFRPDKL